MERGQGAILLFVGALLIYLSIYGLSSLPFTFALTGDILKEDWNSLGYWFKEGDGTQEIRTGTLYQNGLTSRAMVDLFITADMPSQFTFEVKVRVINWGDQGVWVWQIYDKLGYRAFMFSIRQTKASWQYESPITLSSLDNEWHIWTLTVDVTAPKATLYKDSVLVGSWNAGAITGTTSAKSRFVYGALGPPYGAEVYTDYCYVDNGLKPPSDQPPLNKGTLRVFGSYQGSYVATSVTITGPETKTGTTTTDVNNPLKFDLTPGTYTVQGTYSSVPQSTTVSVVASQTVDALLNFGGTTPPPVIPDILQIIKEIFQNPTVKSLMLIGGLAMTGVGAIGLFMPRKRPVSPSAPYY